MANKTLLLIFLMNLFSLHQVLAANPVLTGREAIRIATFYHLDDASPEIQKVISEQLMPAAISYYQAALKVNRLKQPIGIDLFSSQSCAEVEPHLSFVKGVEADLVLFVRGYWNFENDKERSNAIAFAVKCGRDHQTNRPIIGSVNYNLDMLNQTESLETIYEKLLMATLHEIGHILGFSDSDYDLFINPLTGERLGNTTMTKEVNGMMVKVLTLDPLTRRLRDHFACPTLEGAYLEQQGGNGSKNSHFERRVFMNELMTASSSIDERISEFYFAMLEGTGWYTPNYNMSEPMFWGKGKGCEFLNTKCLNSFKKSNFPDHFCTDFGGDSCSYDRQSYSFYGGSNFPQDASLQPAFNYWGDGTILTFDSFSDNCPYKSPLPTMLCQDNQNLPDIATDKEYFGPQSACFLGSLNTSKTERPFCLKQACQELEPNQYTLNIEFEDQTVVCRKEGPIKLENYQGYINCPDPVMYCTLISPHFCRRGCMGRGTCVKNQCVCREGYYGSDCSFRNVSKTQAEGSQVVSERESDQILALLIIVILVVLVVVIQKKITKRDQNDQERKGSPTERKEQRISNSEDSSRLEMPNFRLLNADWNQHEGTETQIAQQNIPYVKIGN